MEKSDITDKLDSLSVEGKEAVIKRLQAQLANQKPKILVICPAIEELELTMRERGELCSEDLKLAQTLCIQLTNNSKAIHTLEPLTMSRMGQFTDRIVLYDGELLQIRVHIFRNGANETFIHDHQYHFISCCIQGSYLHRLYNIVKDSTDNKIYIHTRQSGGVYAFKEEMKGDTINVCAQPFKKGQTLFLGAAAIHTVQTEGQSQAVTITLRDKRRRNEGASIFSATPSRSGRG